MAGIFKISIHALREEGDDFHRRAIYNYHNFYPRPPRGGRRPVCGDQKLGQDISIHALREEGDELPTNGKDGLIYFYPRPPRGGRPTDTAFIEVDYLFLSTPSARRATMGTSSPPCPCGDFYPRPPRGGRRGIWEIPKTGTKFLSTPSARRATAG